MDKKIKTGQSKGILEGLTLSRNEEKKESTLEVKREGSLEGKKESSKFKRSYMLSEDTIKKLERMKLDDFPAGTSLESIVEKAIIYFYENTHK